MGLISRVSSRTYRYSKMSTTNLEILSQNCLESAIHGDANIGGLDITNKNIHLVHQFEQSKFKKSPLEVAIMNSNFEWIKDMLEKLGIQPDLEVENEDKDEENEDEESVENKINSGSVRPSTLQLAIDWGNIDIVRLLVEYGAKLDGIDVEELKNDEVKEMLKSQIEGTLVPVYKVDAKKKKKK